MQAPAKSAHLGFHTGIVLALLAIPAHAQQAKPAAQIPDYAAVLGSPQVVRDGATGTRRGLNQQEVQQRLNAKGGKRTSKQRRDSQALNEAIHAMPATIEEAFRTAKPNAQGVLVVRPSREELVPIVGVVDADGGVQASHDPADIGRADQ